MANAIKSPRTTALATSSNRTLIPVDGTRTGGAKPNTTSGSTNGSSRRPQIGTNSSNLFLRSAGVNFTRSKFLRGDLGAVVDIHAPDRHEVELVLASGKTQALVSLRSTDVRAVGDGDLIAVRDLKRTA